MNPKIAIKIILAVVVAVTIFHFSILLKIVPYEITWGGRLKSDEEMYVFETISLLINFYLGLVVLIKGRYIAQFLSPKIVTVSLWMFAGLFALNTLGNVMAETTFEKFFAIVTLILSVLIITLARDKD